MNNPHLRRALQFVTPYWRRLALVLVLSFLSTGLSLLLPLVSKDFFDTALLGRNLPSLLRTSAIFAALTVVSFIINVVSGMRYTRVSADILFDMRLEMYRHLLHLSPRFYARTRLGDIMSRINNDIGEIQRVAAEAALAWVGNVLYLVGTVAMLAWLDLRLFLATVAVAPLGIWATSYYRKRLEGQVGELRQRSADLGSFLIETIQAMRLVVMSNAQDREVARFRQRNSAFVDSLMSMQYLTYVSGALPGLILSAGTGMVFVYGGYRVVHGDMTVGTFVAFIAYQTRFLPPLQALMGLYASLATAQVSLQRVSEILDAPIEVREAPDAVAPERVEGRVEFSHVTLSFDRGRPALEGMSFRVEPGEVLAIVGPSGSGKSTIADLLLRLLDPDEGVIRLDGVDLRQMNLRMLRKHVALVDQEPCILHASIAENIRYSRPEATEAEVRLAARQAALEPFIAGLPQGYETVVGERGSALSAGERQRIATARAFLANPAVLILDEPTASLDPHSERTVIDGYETVMRNRTTIVITHRLDVASRADRVLVVDGSRLVEQGSPAELAMRDSRYANLFHVQTTTTH
ncbi:MAG: ABC transporter ATP-binding protein [Vicinamibacterales bacterium]